MLSFKFDQNKAITSILYISSKLIKEDIKPDFHKIFKILYFAEQRHLAKYGRPIIGDHYIAMEHGPVASRLYDILKIVRGDSISQDTQGFSEVFNVTSHFVHPKKEPDMDEFSDSDLECIDDSISQNKSLGFVELKNKSHDEAYKKAAKDDRISFRRMAKAAGADAAMLAYIITVSDNNDKTVSK